MNKIRSNLLNSTWPAEGLFFARWLIAPHKIGAVAPASRHLARAMAAQIVPGSGLVVELGAGTGSVTKALLERGLAPAELIIVESDAAFCALLKRRFPALRVICGDAAELSALLAPLGVERAASVVSSLPLLSMPHTLRRRIIDESFALLAEQGAFIQYTYGAFSPLRRRKSGLKGELAARIWRNFPPAAVWRFRRRSATAHATWVPAAPAGALAADRMVDNPIG
jgi:phosphatidylethanolamine/phosphatidyl-N-methylethanolamine N-methyltransferase